MPARSDPSISEIKDLILTLDKRIDSLDQKIDLKLESVDRKIDGQFAALDRKIDVQFAEVKGELKQLDERINGLEKLQSSLETLIRDQGNRFWALVGGAFLALFGLLAKMAFFPTQIS